MNSKEKCKSVLVADDNDDVRETIVEALTSEGYFVMGARNGEDAIEKLKEMPAPTLILLDLMMPVMNGWEFLDAQSKDSKFAQHQIVTISAVNSTKTLEDTSSLDVQGFLQKPLTLGGLYSKVREFCGPNETKV